MLFFAIVAGLEAKLMGKSIVYNHGLLEVLEAKLPRFIFCAITVGFLEEIMFRGIILKMFYTAFSPILAAILSSVFFAFLHIKIPSAANINTLNVGIWSGFKCIFPMICGFLYEFNVLQFVKLVLFGCILSTITLKSRSLVPPIGFHAGTVLMLFSLGLFI
jgi:membrane protease YdiL (CAAX protease family)